MFVKKKKDSNLNIAYFSSTNSFARNMRFWEGQKVLWRADHILLSPHSPCDDFRPMCVCSFVLPLRLNEFIFDNDNDNTVL